MSSFRPTAKYDKRCSRPRGSASGPDFIVVTNVVPTWPDPARAAIGGLQSIGDGGSGWGVANHQNKPANAAPPSTTTSRERRRDETSRIGAASGPSDIVNGSA